MTQAIPLDISVCEYLLHLVTLFLQSTSKIKENFTPSGVDFSLTFWTGKAALCILELRKSGCGRKSFLHWFWYEQGEPLGILEFCVREGVTHQAQVIHKGFTDNDKNKNCLCHM